MKLFVLANTLLGPVIQGTEATHHVASFLLSGQTAPTTLAAITEWIADAERQVIVKKGGDHNALANIYATLISSKEIAGEVVETLKYSIHRDSRMNSCIMSIGILVPDSVVLAAETMLQGNDTWWNSLDAWSQAIMTIIIKCPNVV